MTVLLFSSNKVQICDSSLKNCFKRSNVRLSLHKTNSLVLLSTLGNKTSKQSLIFLIETCVLLELGILAKMMSIKPLVFELLKSDLTLV
jgi:hypothetical protein